MHVSRSSACMYTRRKVTALLLSGAGNGGMYACMHVMGGRVQCPIWIVKGEREGRKEPAGCSCHHAYRTCFPSRLLCRTSPSPAGLSLHGPDGLAGLLQRGRGRVMCRTAAVWQTYSGWRGDLCARVTWVIAYHIYHISFPYSLSFSHCAVRCVLVSDICVCSVWMLSHIRTTIYV